MHIRSMQVNKYLSYQLHGIPQVFVENNNYGFLYENIKSIFTAMHFGLKPKMHSNAK